MKKDFTSLRGKHPVLGLYVILDENGKAVGEVHNYLTYAGASKIAKLVAGTISATEWRVGMLSGPAKRDDTQSAHSWTEPTSAQGYTRQPCTVSEIIDTKLSEQPATVVVFTPVTFSCSENNTAWDKAYSNSFLAMKDNQEEPETEIISISSQLPSPVRLLPGTSYQMAYRLYFMT